MPFFSHLCSNPASEKQSIGGTSQCGAENINKALKKNLFFSKLASTEVMPTCELQFAEALEIKIKLQHIISHVK